MVTVGCLIKDEYYNAKFENVAIISDSLHGAISLSLGMGELDEGTTTLLRDLQIVHDDYAFNAAGCNICRLYCRVLLKSTACCIIAINNI